MADEYKPPLPSTPDYRWQLAAEMVSARTPPSRGDPEEALFRTAYNFIMRLRNGKGSAVRKLQREYPDLYMAHALFQHRDSECWILEAGLLTTVPKADLARFVAVSTEVVDLYEKYFYSVRDKLESRGYILNHILMPAVIGGLSGRDFDFLYKTLAYCAGWGVFADFLEVRQMDRQTEDWIYSSFRSRLLKQGWIAAHRVEINNFNAVEILDKCLMLKRLESEFGDKPVQDEAMALLQGLLGQLSLPVTSNRDNIIPDEPRAAQLLLNAVPVETYEPLGK
jgi:hypothetical protein